MFNYNINKSYVDGTQALTYCQSAILPIHLFSMAVSTVTQPATYSWRTLQCLSWTCSRRFSLWLRLR